MTRAGRGDIREEMKRGEGPSLAPSLPVAVVLSLPPSVNHCYVTTFQGKRVLTKEGRLWITAAGRAASAAAHVAGYRWGGGFVRVSLTAHWPDNRRRDVSNLHKLTLDAIEGIAYPDDKWALTHDEVPHVSKKHPRLEVMWEAVT